MKAGKLLKQVEETLNAVAAHFGKKGRRGGSGHRVGDYIAVTQRVMQTLRRQAAKEQTDGDDGQIYWLDFLYAGEDYLRVRRPTSGVLSAEGVKQEWEISLRKTVTLYLLAEKLDPCGDGQMAKDLTQEIEHILLMIIYQIPILQEIELSEESRREEDGTPDTP